MISFSAFMAGLSIIADPYNLLLIFAGLLIGTIIGILPGIGATMTIALLLPFTMVMDPIPALSLLLAIYCSNAFAGAISAILLNVPGSAAAVVTCLDGYPLAKRGEAGRALGIATVASTIGGIFSTLVFIAGAPLLAGIAYQFGPPEYFALTVFGLALVASISTESSTLKNLFGATLGLLLATVGMDFTTAAQRFTFGSVDLMDGIQVVPVLIGLFAITELLSQSQVAHLAVERLTMNAMKLPSWADYKRIWKILFGSSTIGTVVGVLPGEGGTVSSLIAYSEARRWSRRPDEFGKGSIEGLTAAEAANNAAIGGALIPTLALGIPGGSVTAVILVGLTAQGVRPGPYLFEQQPHFIYAIFAILMLANVLWLGLGMIGAKVFARLTFVPPALLWPSVFLISVVGAYSLDQSMFDVWTMLAAGVIGFVLRRFGFSVIPIAMGMILGTILENSLKQSMIIFSKDWTMFFDRPLVVLFFLCAFAASCGPTIARMLSSAIRAKRAANSS